MSIDYSSGQHCQVATTTAVWPAATATFKGPHQFVKGAVDNLNSTKNMDGNMFSFIYSP